MYIHVADRRVSANPSGKTEMEIGRGKEQCQGGGDEWCKKRTEASCQESQGREKPRAVSL